MPDISDLVDGWVWVPDSGWVVLDPDDGRLCRFPRCWNPAVAALYRRRRGGLPIPWAYCPDHMYGRRIIDGVVHSQVAADSPAARRGHSLPHSAMDSVQPRWPGRSEDTP